MLGRDKRNLVHAGLGANSFTIPQAGEVGYHGGHFRPEGNADSIRANPREVLLYIQQFLLSSSLRRGLRSLVLVAVASSLLAVCAVAQNNPVPQIVGPVHPDAVAPGGGDFTLSVYGANFVPGAVVNWNYQPRATTYISGHELQAQILSTDIAKNTAGYVTVTNPAPGGGPSSSSWAQVEVHAPISTISVVSPPPQYPFGDWQMQAADFTHDGILGLVGQYGLYLGYERGKGNGTFWHTGMVSRNYLSPTQFAYGDFNGDGNIDIAVVNGIEGNVPWSPYMSVRFGDGKGNFTAGPTTTFLAGLGPVLVAGDFNRDGKLDLISRNTGVMTELLGNGDGTFQRLTDFPYSYIAYEILAGDFNGDGKLDLLLVQDPYLGQGFGVALWFFEGNGDGTFQKPRQIISLPGAMTCQGGANVYTPVQLSDFNGDGKLDLAFCTLTQIGVMLGNGDGTFRPPIYYTTDAAGSGQFTFAIGDINSDGKPDLIVSDYYLGAAGPQLAVFLGNGDGTFQTQQVLASGLAVPAGETGITLGDFNSDGLLDVILQNGGFGMWVYLQQ
jgi:hypothetical protein